MIVKLSKSPIVTKKWRVTGPDWTVNFGAKGYMDYTMHHDPERKSRYIIRHQRRENWKDPKTAGFWSRWLLWEAPNMQQAKRIIKQKFNITVK
jgi:hypothetical protein